MKDLCFSYVFMKFWIFHLIEPSSNFIEMVFIFYWKYIAHLISLVIYIIVRIQMGISIKMRKLTRDVALLFYLKKKKK